MTSDEQSQNASITDQQKLIAADACVAAAPLARILVTADGEHLHDFVVACFGCLYGALMSRLDRDAAQRVVADFAIYSAMFERMHPRSDRKETLQ